MTPSNYVPETKACSQQLRYSFNNDELIERGKKLSETHSKYAQLEADKKRVVTDFTAKMTAVKAEASSLAEMVSTGYELRDIACTATMDTPTLGKKRITRDDTGEEVTIEPMTPSENSAATDARAKAEYDLKNPVLELEAPGAGEQKSEQEHTDTSNDRAASTLGIGGKAADPVEAGDEQPDSAIPESDAAGEGEDEEEPTPPPAKKKTKKSKPSSSPNPADEEF